MKKKAQMKITFSMSMIYNIEIVRVKKNNNNRTIFFCHFHENVRNKFNLNKFSFELFLLNIIMFFFLRRQ